LLGDAKARRQVGVVRTSTTVALRDYQGLERSIQEGEGQTMRQGWSVASGSLIVVLALCGLARLGLSDEPAAPDEVTVLDERFGVRTAPILLLTRPDVQLDLRLDPGQISGAKRTIARLLERGLRLKDQPVGDVEAARRAINAEMTDWLGRQLSDEQLQRLGQIDLQWEGVSAMISRPMVTEYLTLTHEQRRTLARILSERDARRARGLSTTVDEANLWRQALANLSAVQKDKWARLLGQPCRFSIHGKSPAPGNPADRR
jgi:hypothetical protein